MKTLKGIDYIKYEQNYFLQTVDIVGQVARLSPYLKVNPYLLDIIFQSIAYSYPIKEAALQEYVNNNWEVKKFSHLADSDLKELVNGSEITGYKSSVYNRRWNKNMKKLLRSSIALDKVPGEESMRKARQQMDEDYLPRFKNYRGERALAIKQKYCFGSDLFEKAYESIIKLVSGKEQVSKKEELELIKLIELYGIGRGLKELYLDLGFAIKSLVELRQLTPKEVKNTACYHCGKTLYRRGNGHYCSKVENRRCCEERSKLNKRQMKELWFILSEKICIKCGKDASFNHIYARKQYCSKRCYDTYRKIIQRKRTVPAIAVAN